MIVLLLTLAAGFGALLRFVVDGHIRMRLYRGFPWGTTLINISGALLLGILTGLTLYHHANPSIKLIFGTGFCGGYTTFSTASFETVRLLEERRFWSALLHACTNLSLTILAAGLGLWLVHH